MFTKFCESPSFSQNLSLNSSPNTLGNLPRIKHKSAIKTRAYPSILHPHFVPHGDCWQERGVPCPQFFSSKGELGGRRSVEKEMQGNDPRVQWEIGVKTRKVGMGKEAQFFFFQILNVLILYCIIYV